jgi:hypothetical protein
MKSFLIFGSLILLLFIGCGKKGEPRAPELAMPQLIKNLAAKPDRNGIVLTWSRPTEYVDGKPLTDLTGFVIFRKDLSPSCPECPVPYRPLTAVNVEDREKFVKQKQYRFIDENAQAQMIYRYRVSSQLKDGSLSNPSNEVEVTRGP